MPHVTKQTPGTGAVTPVLPVRPGNMGPDVIKTVPTIALIVPRTVIMDIHVLPV